MFAGDKFDTRAQAYFDDKGKITHFRRLGGDGTVWLQSATRENESDARVSFNKHSRIFDDKGLKVELSWILTPDGPLTDFAAVVEELEFDSTAGNTIPVDLVSFEVSPAVVTLGKTVTIRMELSGAEITSSDDNFKFIVCADIPSSDGTETCFDLLEVSASDSSRNFEAGLDVDVPGDFTIRLERLAELEDYFAVVEID